MKEKYTKIIIMRRIIYTYLVMLFSLPAFTQTRLGFTLKGKIEGGQYDYVSLIYTNNEGKLIKDSCALQNYKFCFEGNISEPTWTIFKWNKDSGDNQNSLSTIIYLEPGDMIITTVRDDPIETIKITGSETQKQYEMLQKQYIPLRNESDSLQKMYEKTNNEYITAKKNKKNERVLDSILNKLNNINKQIAPFEAKFSERNYRFVATYPDSYVSAYLLTLYKSRWPLDTVRLLYNKLNPAVQNSFFGKEVGKRIRESSDNTAGKMAKNFTNLDINGRNISLSDFKGKYVLLDFWGSWCVPCREGNPHLIKLYKKYHDQGLEIIGIASDTDPDAWKKAVEKDGVGIWHNILSGLQEKDNWAKDRSQWVNREFGVYLYPTKILIDQNGKIIGRYDGNEDASALDIKLRDIFK